MLSALSVFLPLCFLGLGIVPCPPCPSAAPLPKNSCPWDGGGYLILELLFPALGLPERREGGGAEGGTLGGDTATPQVAPRELGVPFLGWRWQMEHPSARSAWHGATGLWGRARCLQPVPGCWLCPAGSARVSVLGQPWHLSLGDSSVPCPRGCCRGWCQDHPSLIPCWGMASLGKKQTQSCAQVAFGDTAVPLGVLWTPRPPPNSPCPRAESQPTTSDETVVAGGTVVLKCQVEDPDDSSLQWSNPAQQTLYFGEKRGKTPGKMRQNLWENEAAPGWTHEGSPAAAIPGLGIFAGFFPFF